MIAAEIEHKYKGMLGYPSLARDYEADMSSVAKARAVLAKVKP